MRSAILSILALSAAAQDWGTVGAWETLIPTTSGPPLAFRGATTVAGTVVVIGNSSAGNLAAFAFDPHTLIWSQWPDLTVPINDPFTCSYGGTIMVVDETNVSSILTINSAAARSTVGYTWSSPQISGGPAAPRFGQRFIAWGSTILWFGGVEIGKCAASRDDDRSPPSLCSC